MIASENLTGLPVLEVHGLLPHNKVQRGSARPEILRGQSVQDKVELLAQKRASGSVQPRPQMNGRQRAALQGTSRHFSPCLPWSGALRPDSGLDLPDGGLTHGLHPQDQGVRHHQRL